jgi:hypothetical protein
LKTYVGRMQNVLVNIVKVTDDLEHSVQKWILTKLKQRRVEVSSV